MRAEAARNDASVLIDGLSQTPRLQALAAKGVIRRFASRAELMSEGNSGDTLFILLRGRVKVFAADASGRQIVFGIHGPGDYVGEMSLDGGQRSATVAAMEPVVAAMVTRQTVLAFIRSEPEFAFDLLSRVIRRARLATESARNLALMSVYGRVAQVLNDAGGTPAPAARLTHREIAARVGASREMVSRIMRDLSEGGYIDSNRAGITIKRALPAAW